MKRIGISNKTRFWQQYVFSDPPKGYIYERAFDAPWHVLGVNDQFLLHTKYFAPLKKFDLFHTYNSIVVNKHPWVIEVESYLPRYKPMREDRRLYKWATDKLAGEHCKKIIFTSENSSRMNRQNLIDNGVDPQKMAVVYRAVEQYAPTNSNSNTFNILFAGNGFYRKGGMELLRAMEAIDRDDIRLKIVSSMDVDWAVFPTEEELKWVFGMIEKDPRIELVKGMAHDQLIKEMQNAHLFVSTTWSDPFNNTILEAMACGTPIICSNISSLPEIVQDGCNGYLLDIENLTRSAVAEMITERIQLLLNDSEVLRNLSSGSERIVKEKFDIRVRNRRLEAIYAAIN